MEGLNSILRTTVSAVVIFQMLFFSPLRAFADGETPAPQISVPAQTDKPVKKIDAPSVAIPASEKPLPGNMSDTTKFLQNNTLAPAAVSAALKSSPSPAPVNSVIDAFKYLIGEKKYTPKTQDRGELGLNVGLVKTVGTLSEDKKTMTLDFYTLIDPDDVNSEEIFSTRIIIDGDSKTAVIYDICSADYQGVERKTYPIAALTGIQPSIPRGFEAVLVTQGYGSSSGEYSKKITGDNFYELMVNTSMREMNNYFSLDYFMPVIAEQFGLDLPAAKWSGMTPLYDREGTILAVKASIEGAAIFFKITSDEEGNLTIDAITDHNKNGRMDPSDIKQTQDYLNSIAPFLPAISEKSPGEVQKRMIVLQIGALYFEGAKIGLVVRGIIAYLMIDNRAYLLINNKGKPTKYALPGYIWPWLFPKSLLTL